jgi:hypothetical protein
MTSVAFCRKGLASGTQTDNTHTPTDLVFYEGALEREKSSKPVVQGDYAEPE